MRVVNRLHLTHLLCSYCFPFPLQNTLTNIFCTLNIWLMLTANIYESESESHSVISDFLRPHGLCSPWNYPGQNTGVHSFSLLQGIFPTQGLNPGLHCRQILYQLNQPDTSSKHLLIFSGGSVIKNPPANAGDIGLIPGLG